MGAALLGLCVLLSRVPFLLPGYGLDQDAALLVLSGRTLALEGVYYASRFPGYPVLELVYSVAWRGGPLAVNGLTALASAVAVVAFAGVVHRLGGRHAALAGLAMATVPIVYVESVTAMDYMWALAFLMGSLWAAVERRPVLSGILLGVAGACRLTSLAFGIPIALFLSVPEDATRTTRYIARFASSAVAAWLACFSPVLVRYGTDFLHYMPFRRPLWESAWMLTLGTWGVVGCLALAGWSLAVLAGGVKGARPRAVAIPDAARPKHAMACLLGVAIGLGVFLRLPIEAAYAIPAIPFLLLLLGSRTPRTLFSLGCVVMLAAPFVGFGTGAHEAQLLQHARERRQLDTYLDATLEAASRLPAGATVIAGYTVQELDLMQPPGEEPPVTFVTSMPESEVEAARAASVPIYYLPEAVDVSDALHEEDLNVFALPLHVGGQGGLPLPPPRAAGRLQLD